MAEDEGENLSEQQCSRSNENGFEQLGLDSRCVKAVGKKGLRAPTAVQARAIPLCLAGRDVVAIAGTGTGKTIAYLLPVIHTLLLQQEERAKHGIPSAVGQPPPYALVLVPTSELASQVRAEAASLTSSAGASIRCASLPGAGAPSSALKAAARAAPDILIATPARVALCLRQGYFQHGAVIRSLHCLVLDEADLLTGYGYSHDLEQLASLLPRSCRSMLVSATSRGGVDHIASLLLSNYMWVDASEQATTQDAHTSVTENAEDSSNLQQASVPSTIAHFRVECMQRDLLLHVLALIKLGSVKRKSLVFTSNAHSCVRLKLFLERFGVHCAAVHGEQPRNSRDNTLAQFNKGLFDHLIAAESGKGDAEFGVARGIDFKGVRTVISVGLPESAEKYVHRAGRTGRAGRKGTCIVVAPQEQREELDRIEGELKRRLGDDFSISPFQKLNRKAVESMRYRAEDVLRSLGKNAVREARLRQLRMELMNSKKLEEHLAANPDDKSLLKHDRMLAKSEPPKHLSHVPDYIKLGTKQQRNRNQPASALSSIHGATPGSDESRKRKRKRGEQWEAAGGTNQDPLKQGFRSLEREKAKDIEEAQAATQPSNQGAVKAPYVRAHKRKKAPN